MAVPRCWARGLNCAVLGGVETVALAPQEAAASSLDAPAALLPRPSAASAARGGVFLSHSSPSFLSPALPWETFCFDCRLPPSHVARRRRLSGQSTLWLLQKSPLPAPPGLSPSPLPSLLSLLLPLSLRFRSSAPPPLLSASSSLHTAVSPVAHALSPQQY